MTTLRKLPTIAPKTNAKKVRPLKVASYDATPATRPDVLARGAAAHLPADHVGEVLRRGRLLRVQVYAVGVDRDHELVLLRWRRRSRHLHLRRHFDVEAHQQDRRRHPDDD